MVRTWALFWLLGATSISGGVGGKQSRYSLSDRGSFVEILGVCKITAGVQCWDASGQPDDLLTDDVAKCLESRRTQRVYSVVPGKKTRYLVAKVSRNTLRNEPHTSYSVVDPQGRFESYSGDRLRTEFVHVGAESTTTELLMSSMPVQPEETSYPIQVRISSSLPAATLRPAADSKVAIGSYLLGVLGYEKDKKDQGSDQPSPPRWNLRLKVTPPPVDRMTCTLSALDKSGQQILRVNQQGRPVPPEFPRIYSPVPPKSPPKLPQVQIRYMGSYIYIGSLFVGDTVTLSLPIDPKWIKEFSVYLTLERIVDLCSVPLDPKS